MTNDNPDNKWIGKRTPRPDGADKVTGRAAYAADTNMPGMIWGKVLRSPHPHARIKSIDVSKARALPGVKAVISHENCAYVWGAGSVAGGQQSSRISKARARGKKSIRSWLRPDAETRPASTPPLRRAPITMFRMPPAGRR